MNLPLFGQNITVKAKAVKDRDREYAGNGYSMYQESRWKSEEIEPTEVMYIGWRTVSDCNFRRSGRGEDYNEGMTRLNYRRVYVVVANERTNPFYVFPEDILYE